MNNELLKQLNTRRSIYALGKNLTQDEDAIVAMIEDVIQATPSAFNSQTVRAVFLFNANHDKLWDLVKDRLKSEVPTQAAYEKTKAKIDGFKAAYGTILYFTDSAVVRKLEHDFPLYAANFAGWAEQAQGSSQLNSWVALAQNHIGANLQHYNPLIDDLVKKTFNLPETWTLRGQMPFGSIEAPAGEKTTMAKVDQFIVLK